MNGSSVSLDTVSIQIEASAKNAGNNIEKLTQTLYNLKSTTKGGFNNLSKLAQSLEELKSSSKHLSTVSKNLDNLKNVQETLQGLSNISNPKGLNKALDNLERLPYIFNNMDASAIANVARVSKDLSDALTPLANKLSAIGVGYSALNQLADRYGVSVTKIREGTQKLTINTKNYSNMLQQVVQKTNDLRKVNENFFKSLSKGSSKVISKIKQIGLSLLGTRTIFTATRKAVSEYMAMDAELTWKVTNNWRALGAQLAPAIENVTWLFKQFIRVIYSVILALTGIDLISRANEKAMLGWGKAAKSTLGNLQKFDDLNVVEFPKGSGGDDDKLIDLDTIDLSPIQKVIDWVRKLRDEIKEAWNSGQWEGVGKVLAEGLNGAMKALDFTIAEEKLKGVADKFGNFLHGVVDDFDWSLFGERLTQALSFVPRVIISFLNNVPWSELGEGINKALTTFKPKIIIDAILGSLNTLILGIQEAFLKIDGHVLGQKISEAIIAAFDNFSDLLSKIEWKQIGIKIKEVIEGIDWKGIWDSVVKVFEEAFSGVDSFFEGLFGSSGIGKTIAGGLGALFAIDKGSKLVSIFKSIGKSVGDLGTAFSLLGKNTLSTETISAITGVGKPLLDVVGALGGGLPIIGAVIAAVVVLGAAIKDLWQNNEEFRTTVTDLFDSIQSTVLPLLKTIFGLVKQLWKDVVVPLFNLLVEIVKPFIVALVEILDVLWRNVLEPIVGVLTEILKNVLPPVIDVLKQVIDVVTWLWKNVLSPVVSFVLDVVIATIKLLTGDVSGAIETMSGAFLNLIDAGKNLWKQIVGFFQKMADGIKEKIDKIKNDWTKFWSNLKNSPKEMLQGLINMFNNVIGKLNDKLAINIGPKTAKLLKVLGVNDISEGKYQLFSIPKIPALETGTNEVEYEGIYHLHPGEAVVPEKYNPALGNGTNAETNSRLDKLIELLENTDMTTIVNLGNKELLKTQQKFIKSQNDKYGTDVRF